MVYSGDKLIFGVQMDLDDAIKYIIKYVKKNEKDIYESIDMDMLDDDNNSDKYYYFDDIVNKLDLSIELLKAQCCYFNDYGDDDDEFSKVYLGTILCCNNIVSRFDISSFDTFEEYKDFYTEGIKYGEIELANNKKKYIEDLQKILPKTKVKPRYYSLPNDCYTCT